MRLIAKEKYVLLFDFLIWSLKVWIWAFLLPISFSCLNDTGKFPKFSSGLEETLVMRLITKEKVLRLDFLIWSLKVWIWAFFAIYKLINRPLPSKRQGEIFWIFPQGLRRQQLWDWSQKKNVSYDSIFWYYPSKFLTVHLCITYLWSCEFECPMSNVQYPANFTVLAEL